MDSDGRNDQVPESWDAAILLLIDDLPASLPNRPPLSIQTSRTLHIQQIDRRQHETWRDPIAVGNAEDLGTVLSISIMERADHQEIIPHEAKDRLCADYELPIFHDHESRIGKKKGDWRPLRDASQGPSASGP